jgi:hypothetical protein
MSYDNNKPKPVRAGALWVNKARSGMEYFSGSIEMNGQTLKVVGFWNREKKNEKSPDINLQVSEETIVKPAPAAQKEIDLDEIPF